MRERSLQLEILLELEEAIRRIEQRFQPVAVPLDLTKDDRGLERLDSICMMLLTISENIRRLEKVAGADIFCDYPELNWSEVKGIRNILAHDYFSIDPEEIFATCRDELPTLKQVLQHIRFSL
jgi:uncharacterized protein with HEPN domain